MYCRNGLVMMTTLLSMFACATESSDVNGSGGGGGISSSGGSTSGTGATAGSGGNAASSSGAAPGTGGTSATTPNVCETCIDASCSAPIEACESDAECLALLNCLEPCLDQTCADQCLATHAAGKSLLDTADACVASTCANECGSGSQAADPCETCVDAKCAAQLSACTSDPQCSGLWNCYDQCPDDACAIQCETTFAAGLFKSDAVDMCAEQQCPTECGAV